MATATITIIILIFSNHLLTAAATITSTATATAAAAAIPATITAAAPAAVPTPFATTSALPTSYAAAVVPTASAADVDPRDIAAAIDARVLVNASTWGVVSSLNYGSGNTPFGNALSFSDGGSGTPYFYLTVLDQATANFTAADARSSLSISQYALGTCLGDPQEPNCVKVTLSGVLRKVDPSSREGRFANLTLFARHPRFTKLPAVANFQLYKLEVKNVFVINTYGDPRFPSVKLYRSVKLS